MIIKNLNSLEFQKKIENLKLKKKKIGLCHGVFDLLHLGHIKHFNEAKKISDILIVSVTEDKHVAKGPGRPAFNQLQRMDALSNLRAIDYVILSNETSAIDILKKIKPDFYFKGPDYKQLGKDITKKILNEKKEVEKYGGKLVITKSKKYSSSNLINDNLNILTEEQKNIIKKVKIKFNFEKIREIIEDLKNIKPLIVGETIIDHYFFCETIGKSGKEPTLVMRYSYDEMYLGGAGAISRHVSQFCKKNNFLTMIGEKENKLDFIKKNLPKNTKSYFLKKKNSPTILKKRFLDEINKSKVLGVYSLDDSKLSIAQENELIKKMKQISKYSDLTILSDYGHGMITSKLRKELIKNSNFIAVNAQVNAGNIGYHSLKNYSNINFMIINELELRHEMRSKDKKVEFLIKALSKKQKINYLVVTRGSAGAILYQRIKDKLFYTGAFSKTSVDKIGAGDAMLSLLALCLYKKIDVNLSLLLSSLVAAQSVNIIGNKSSINKLNLIKSLEHILS
jgi:rfaE bifunctional protein kinase chain/domain/rfaE bifunctional protein nucleotidyltransferase chain/domain